MKLAYMVCHWNVHLNISWKNCDSIHLDMFHILVLWYIWIIKSIYKYSHAAAGYWTVFIFSLLYLFKPLKRHFNIFSDPNRYVPHEIGCWSVCSSFCLRFSIWKWREEKINIFFFLFENRVGFLYAMNIFPAWYWAPLCTSRAKSKQDRESARETLIFGSIKTYKLF